ncbi:hypothetical protein ACGFNP_32275 [Nonomuraea sp. NPDC049269]|uniref:hypothetical protein n=1 Tax=Nonomuraea sp. NPDC049269 TaxID=3364349 RepID=UPI003721F707
MTQTIDVPRWPDSFKDRLTAPLPEFRELLSVTWHGTFVLSGEPLLAPIESARSAWHARGLPREGLWDLAIGESRSFLS